MLLLSKEKSNKKLIVLGDDSAFNNALVAEFECIMQNPISRVFTLNDLLKNNMLNSCYCLVFSMSKLNFQDLVELLKLEQTGGFRFLVVLSRQEKYHTINSIRKKIWKSTRLNELMSSIDEADSSGISFIEIAEDVDKNILSFREEQVLELIADGYLAKQVAVELGIQPSTVETMKKKICRKLGASNTAHAVRIGIQRGVIDLSRKT